MLLFCFGSGFGHDLYYYLGFHFAAVAAVVVVVVVVAIAAVVLGALVAVRTWVC